VRHPRLPKCPARFFANVTKHNFQRRREIVGRREFPCYRLEQTELLFAFSALLFRAWRWISFLRSLLIIVGALYAAIEPTESQRPFIIRPI